MDSAIGLTRQIDAELAYLPESRKILDAARLNLASEAIKYFATLNIGGLLTSSNALTFVKLYDTRPIINPYFTVVDMLAGLSYLSGIYFCGLSWVSISSYVRMIQSSSVKTAVYLRAKAEWEARGSANNISKIPIWKAARQAAALRARAAKQYKECKSHFIGFFMSFVIGAALTSFLFIRIDTVIDAAVKLSVWIGFRWIGQL